jgi:hypothetical protein
MIEPPSCQQYKPGNFLAARPLNWDEIMDEDEDDENWVDRGVPSGGRICPSDGIRNDNGEGGEHMQGTEQETGKGKGTKNRKQQRMGKATEERKGKGNGKGKSSVKQTLEGDDIGRAVAPMLQKEMDEADLDMEG